jgi:hypothetical protein
MPHRTEPNVGRIFFAWSKDIFYVPILSILRGRDGSDNFKPYPDLYRLIFR